MVCAHEENQKSAKGENRGAIDRNEKHCERRRNRAFQVDDQLARDRARHDLRCRYRRVTDRAGRSSAIRGGTRRIDGHGPTVENTTPGAFETKKPAAANKTTAARIAQEPPAASITPAAEPQPESKSVATVTGCLENDEGTFQLTDASGAEAPTARSWKSGFLKKRAAHVELVDAVGLNLRQYTGRRVAVTGTLVERDMRARSVRLIGACD